MSFSEMKKSSRKMRFKHMFDILFARQNVYNCHSNFQIKSSIKSIEQNLEKYNLPIRDSLL